jgi:pantoate--beta-alanine ligase
MLIIKDISHLKLYLKAYRDKGHSIGYVPTMGALHQGHGKLIKQSRDHNQKTVLSTFVNEKQFNNKEDFNNYPRNKGKDYDFCDLHNVDVIFEPSSEEIYPDNKSKLINKYFQNILCDQFRPGHFDGVITVLNELFSIIDVNKVYFGQKDFQQLKIIEKFIEEKFPKLELVSVSTARHEEGIAYSSRNENLSKKQLQEFINFHNSVIQFIKDLDKQISINDANIEAKKFITNLSDQTFDYFEFRNANSLEVEGNISGARLFYAIYKGQTRLIDNIDM